MLDKTYTPDTIGDCKTFYDVTLDDITKYEKDAKKVVSYMVKEFEMKKLQINMQGHQFQKLVL